MANPSQNRQSVNGRTLRTTTAPRRTMGAVVRPQAVDRDDTGLGVQFRCARCAIYYFVGEGEAATCPMCALNRQLQDVRAEYLSLTQQYEMLEREYAGVRRVVDLTLAIREAFDLCTSDDIGFLKEVMYRWKADKGVTLQVTHGPPKIGLDGRLKKNSATAANGFLALFRGGQDQIYKAESIGCLAIAGYFEEAAQSTNHPKAMDTLTRALGQHLTGAVG